MSIIFLSIFFLNILLGPTLSLVHIHHLVTLGLGTHMGTKTLLAELKAALVFANAQEFKAALLIRRKAANLPYDRANKLDALVELALFARLLVHLGNISRLVALIETVGNVALRRSAGRVLRHYACTV